jgi:hypothetical protein
MITKFKPSALRQTRWHEYLVRFVLGGAMTVVAGLFRADSRRKPHDLIDETTRQLTVEPTVACSRRGQKKACPWGVETSWLA